MARKPDDAASGSPLPPENGVADTPRGGKRSKAAAIDLPAGSVVEVQGDASPDSATSELQGDPPLAGATAETARPEAVPSAPERPGRLAPVLIGLVAGLVGGVGAGQLGAYLSPKPPVSDPAVLQRLAVLEKGTAPVAQPAPSIDKIPGLDAALSELRGREKPLRDEIARLGAALAAEREARQKVLAALPSGGGNAGDSAAQEALRKEIASLAGRLDAAEKARPVGGPDPVARAHAGLAAVSLIEAALANGGAYRAPLDLLKRLGADAGHIEALAVFAESGLPPVERLVQEYRAAPVLATRPEQILPQKGFWERLKDGAGALVEVRKAGETTASDDATRMAQGEAVLKRGDLAGAVARIDQFTPPLAADFRPLRARLAAILKARAAIGALRTEALAQLTKAATP